MKEKKNLQPKPSKQRQKTYDKSIEFNGTFEEMIKISTTGAGAKKGTKQPENIEKKKD